MDTVLTESRYEAQIKLEDEARAEGIANYLRMRQRAEQGGDGAMLKPAERLVQHWYPVLEYLILADQKRLRQDEYMVGSGLAAAPMISLPSDVLAALTLRVVLSTMLRPEGRDGWHLTGVSHQLGRSVIDELCYRILKRDHDDAFKKLTSKMAEVDPGRIRWWARHTLEDPMDSKRLHIQVGARLIHHLTEAASDQDYAEEFSPAFEVEMRREGKRTTRYLRMSEAAYEIIEDGHDVRRLLRPSLWPMIVPPTPWSESQEGGYLRLRTPLVTKMKGTTKARVLGRVRKGETDESLEALNYINSVPMSINRQVLAVQRTVWKMGGGQLGLPSRYDEPSPPLPEGFDRSIRGPEKWAGVDEDVALAYKRACLNIQTANRNSRGERTQYAMVLDMASRSAEHDAVYAPHQMDFRGRTYPSVQLCNHQGPDHIRALWQFGTAQGPTDLEWVLYHAANCFGVDKVSRDERIGWATDHVSDMEKSAADPLGYRWWAEADDPWQMLAACFAIEDPYGAGNLLPIQLDGSCNGLQWYGGLLRDHTIAPHVNLVPGDRPGDVYREVATETEAIIQGDAEQGDKIALEVRGLVTRALAKRPTMTYVYGVTMHSAVAYVVDALREAGEDWSMAGARYITACLFRAMERVCPSAVRGMAWLQAGARAICKKGHMLEWTTPNGWLVHQAYYNRRRCKVSTVLGEMWTQNESDPDTYLPRQISGVAPNYIHSLDACHLQRTALRMKEIEAPIAAVHDSYWTTSDRAGDMRHLIRSEFARIQHGDPLADLACQWEERYGVELPELPEYGNWEPDSVLGSDYFFH